MRNHKKWRRKRRGRKKTNRYEKNEQSPGLVWWKERKLIRINHLKTNRNLNLFDSDDEICNCDYAWNMQLRVHKLFFFRYLRAIFITMKEKEGTMIAKSKKKKKNILKFHACLTEFQYSSFHKRTICFLFCFKF